MLDDSPERSGGLLQIFMAIFFTFAAVSLGFMSLGVGLLSGLMGSFCGSQTPQPSQKAFSPPEGSSDLKAPLRRLVAPGAVALRGLPRRWRLCGWAQAACGGRFFFFLGGRCFGDFAE